MIIPTVAGITIGAIGVLIAIAIFNSISSSVVCPDALEEPQGNKHCQSTKNFAWTMIGVLPVGLFFLTFWIIKTLTEGPY